MDKTVIIYTKLLHFATFEKALPGAEQNLKNIYFLILM